MFNPWIAIEQENIKVFYSDKLPQKINAVYDRDKSGAIIILRKGLTRVEERCVLAHELGHHFLSVGNIISTYCSYMEEINQSKQEYKAMCWAIRRLFPKEILMRLSEKEIDEYGVADELQITVDFLQTAKKFWLTKCPPA